MSPARLVDILNSAASALGVTPAARRAPIARLRFKHSFMVLQLLMLALPLRVVKIYAMPDTASMSPYAALVLLGAIALLPGNLLCKESATCLGSCRCPYNLAANAVASTAPEASRVANVGRNARGGQR